MLVGNLVICNYDPETGKEAGLSDEDIEHIVKNIIVLAEAGTDTPQRWLALNNVDY